MVDLSLEELLSDYLSFRLSDDFINSYKGVEPPFGYRDAAGNSVGEITFIRTYSRIKEDGTKERWWEVCRRVIEGIYSIQKNWAKQQRIPWNDNKAQASAKEAFDRMFKLKWTPPGRGLWLMGTPVIMERQLGAGLQNCGFISTYDMTKNDPGEPFAWAMDALMCGVGIGFDVRGSEKNFVVQRPSGFHATTYQIPDAREGWAESIRLLINSYLVPGYSPYTFDYSLIRLYGEPILGFGGVASGPEPLERIHNQIRAVFEARIGDTVDPRLICDIMNLIGTCVVAGNVRRSAELALGSADDKVFMNLKNATVYPERNSYDPDNPGWGWMSNNSVSVKVGDDYTKFLDLIKDNGEPGFIWLDTTRNFGRLVDDPDGKDWRVAGYNPCAEQPLESRELCTLVEVHINNHESKEDFLRTLKFAYLYGKTITLVPTHWPDTNAVMQRNRRIGTSLTGLAQFSDAHGLPKLREWLEHGYATVKSYDRTYSEWLCVRESVRTTTVKPSGTVSILSGHSPGVHWTPGGEYFLRAIRFGDNDPLLAKFKDAGYRVEKDVVSANTYVVYFPIHSNHLRSEKDVSIFEKMNLAAFAQRYWSDNGVSATISFDKASEGNLLGNALNMFDGQFKAISFLPMGNDTYPQMPYTELDGDVYDGLEVILKKVDFSDIYDGGKSAEAAGEAYCTTDVCEMPKKL